MEPLVSIVIPCYNSARWVKETIESALAQTWKNREIIVVDDGSTDESLALARQYEARSVKVIAKANGGASSARNRGIAEAQGEYFQFLDSDDILDPRKIEVQVTTLRDSPPERIASGAWTRFGVGGPTAASFASEPNWKDLSGLDFLVLHYNEGWMMPPIVWLTPRSIVTAIGPWREDISLNDDGEYFCRALLRSSGIVFCDAARSYYRSGIAGSLSRRADVRALKSLVKSIEANAANIAGASDSAVTRSALANAWMELAYEVYPALPEEAKRAAAQAKALGGARRRIQGGRLTQAAFDLLGWRVAARVKRAQQKSGG